MTNDTPLYNLKAVVKEVGLSPATLRAWEHRYGLLKPERTPGGHRLYSRQDIEMLKWLVERQKEGLSISRAVELWNRRSEEGLSLTPQPTVPMMQTGEGDTMLGELREQWLAACMEFDDLKANRILDQAFSLTDSETICSEILQKGLAQVGVGWYNSKVSVQQEHFASAIARRRLDALLAATPTSTHKGNILAACPPGEEHDFVLLLVTYLLKRNGWEVVYLGANVPLNDLDHTIRATSPILVISTAQMLTSAAALKQMAEFVASQGVPLAYGGGIFTHIPELTKRITGHYLGSDINNVTLIVERLTSNPDPVTQALPISTEIIQALGKFEEKKSVIIDFVASMTEIVMIKPAHLQIANDQFSRLVASALALGDVHYLDHSTGWLAGLLGNFGLPTSFAWQFYTAYRLAVDHYMGVDGVFIHDWLTGQINAWHADKE